MNVDVMVNGRPLKVAIEPAGEPGKLTVTIEGKTRVVDASWVDAGTLSLVDAGVVREIRFHAREEAGAVGVEIGGTLYEAIASKRRDGCNRCDGCNGPVRRSAERDRRMPHPSRRRCLAVLCACSSASAIGWPPASPWLRSRP